MFGYVTANVKELSKEDFERYNSIYCGICRQIRSRASNLSRMSLSYDMAFLSLLLMSLYEPEEENGPRACGLHPLRPRQWVDNEFISYGADMNIVLAYYNCLDDWEDDHRISAKAMLDVLGKYLPPIQKIYSRQCGAISRCIQELGRLEKENCGNPDEPANCFGHLMEELMIYREDFWTPTLRQLGFSLGRFIYLLDAAADYRRDLKKKKYNPFLAMGTGEDYDRWEQYLVLAMARCTEAFEKLPLVQDKTLLDNILYSGVWMGFRNIQRKTGGNE